MFFQCKPRPALLFFLLPLNDYLYSDCQNKNACEAAKVGTLAGAATGTAGIVATVAAVGANAMGLATIGATVGGGMAAGAARCRPGCCSRRDWWGHLFPHLLSLSSQNTHLKNMLITEKSLSI
jgi:hypothetical protein